LRCQSKRRHITSRRAVAQALEAALQFDKPAERLIISRPHVLIARYNSAQVASGNQEIVLWDERRLLMDSMLTGALIGAIVGVVIVTIFLIVGAMRKGTSAVKNKPKKILAFIAPMQHPDVMKTVIRFAQQSGYKVDDIANPGWRIILSDSPTFTSYGFFYPVYMSPQPNGGTLVEVGIKSKAIQWGPIVTRKHEQCFNGIRAAVMAGA
jgi:hypothetical protein